MPPDDRRENHRALETLSAWENERAGWEDVPHGGDIYRNRTDCDFSVNVNPLGMPESSMRAAADAIRFCGSYPDARGEELAEAIARAEGVAVRQVILGNGAAELIYALCNAVRPREALAAAPSFGEYEAAVLQAGGRMRFHVLDRKRDFALTEGLADDLGEDTELLFLCNPNNPTGRLTERALLDRIAEACERRGIWLCVDECFLPFAKREEELTMKRELERFPHLIVLRAFTKVYAMAGLRLGYALSADGELLRRMRRTLQPWNTSIPAQRAGIAALAETGYLSRTRELVEREREYLMGELVRTPSPIADWVCPSEANFVLFHSGRDLAERLLERGILIRSCEDFRGLGPGYFRIAVRGLEENRRLIRRMREICGEEEPCRDGLPSQGQGREG